MRGFIATSGLQIQTNGEPMFFENLASTSLQSAKPFYCRSPFTCASSAVVIWERIASRGDRPSHSISEVIHLDGKR